MTFLVLESEISVNIWIALATMLIMLLKNFLSYELAISGAKIEVSIMTKLWISLSKFDKISGCVEDAAGSSSSARVIILSIMCLLSS